MNKKIKEGNVLLTYLIGNFLLTLIFIIGYFIWKTKIWLFLCSIGVIGILFWVVTFYLWAWMNKKELEDEIKNDD